MRAEESEAHPRQWRRGARRSTRCGGNDECCLVPPAKGTVVVPQSQKLSPPLPPAVLVMNKRLAKELQELSGAETGLPFAKSVSLVGDNLNKWKVILIGPVRPSLIGSCARSLFAYPAVLRTRLRTRRAPSNSTWTFPQSTPSSLPRYGRRR